MLVSLRDFGELRFICCTHSQQSQLSAAQHKRGLGSGVEVKNTLLKY